jgi:outer membrane receptor protein involved in Fe transport
VNSLDAGGAQTTFDRAHTVPRGAVFGQTEYAIATRTNAVFSLRLDQSTLHDPELSPRVAVVHQLTPQQTARVTYGRAFQSPSVSEFFLETPVAPPVDLSAVEQALAPVLGGVPLSFSAIPVLAVGNPHLNVEHIQSLEIGYNAVFGRSVFLTATYYRNRLSDFTTNLLPQVGTSLRRLNPDYGPYAPPEALSPATSALVAATLRAVLPPGLAEAMSNRPDGSPVFALLSFGNYGKAKTTGVETSVRYFFNDRWRADVGYSWFGSAITQRAPENPIVPNAPSHQVRAGLEYVTDAAQAALRYRWVDAFDWASGIYQGPVPAYSVLDVNGTYTLTPRYGIGVDIANLLDNDHYELFGGDLLGRRALVHVTVNWPGGHP